MKVIPRARWHAPFKKILAWAPTLFSALFPKQPELPVFRLFLFQVAHLPISTHGQVQTQFIGIKISNQNQAIRPELTVMF
jgi:hypothetical protein